MNAIAQFGSQIAERVGRIVDSVRTAANNPVAQARADGAEVERIARSVVESGRGEQRLQALGQALQGLDASTASAVTAQVFAIDHNAGHWMTAHNVQTGLDSGRIAPREAAAISAGLQGAWLSGDIPFHQFQQASGLQDAAHFYDFGAGQWPTEFRDFINRAGSEPAFAGLNSQFRQAFGELVLSGGITAGPLGEARVSTGGELALALELLDENGDTAIADALAGLTAEQRADVFNRTAGTGLLEAQRAGIVTNGDLFERITDSITAAGEIAGDPAHPMWAREGMAASVSGWQDVAVDLARYVGSSEAQWTLYDGRTQVVPERAEQVTAAVLAHADHVFGALTQGSQNPASGRNDGTELGANLADLAAVLRLTAFSPENLRQADMLTALGDWVTPHVETSNTLPAHIDTDATQRDVDDATARVLGLGAAAQDAFRQANTAANANVEAQRAFVNFVFDVGLAAVPLGGNAKSAVAGELTRVFGTRGASDAFSAAINRGLDSVAGFIVNPATGRLTTEAKDAIVAALGDDQAIVAEVYAHAVEFIDTALVEASNRRNEIGERIVNIRAQIDASR
ncbi:MAG: hypothetical protein ACXIUZ_06025 [Lysobacteraceae bacterium]